MLRLGDDLDERSNSDDPDRIDHDDHPSYARRHRSVHLLATRPHGLSACSLGWPVGGSGDLGRDEWPTRPVACGSTHLPCGRLRESATPHHGNARREFDGHGACWPLPEGHAESLQATAPNLPDPDHSHRCITATSLWTDAGQRGSMTRAFGLSAEIAVCKTPGKCNSPDSARTREGHGARVMTRVTRVRPAITCAQPHPAPTPEEPTR